MKEKPLKLTRTSRISRTARIARICGQLTDNSIAKVTI
jgi:hypothetical protein